jgi:NitT/TauT family transport system permease protein
MPTIRQEYRPLRADLTANVPTRPARRRKVVGPRRNLPRWKRLALGLTGVVAVLGLWQLAVEVGWLDPLLASSPSSIAQAGSDMIQDGTLWPALGSTAKLFAIGFGLSLLIGLPLGALLGWYRPLSAVLDPWVSILYASPRITFIPLLTVWLGVGLQSQVALVVLMAAFPILINVAAGVSAVDRHHFQVARSFLATNRDVLWTVALPGSIPSIVSGIRQGLVQGLVGTVVAEYFIGNTGLGGVIIQAGQSLQTSRAMFCTLIFALAALVLSMALGAAERHLDRWRA